MSVLPPGTILQLMYLHERLQRLKPGHFIEVGPGSGEITQMLLSLGWTGQSFDLEAYTIERLQIRFANEIKNSRYMASNIDFLSMCQPQSADLIISCMVMEHFNDNSESLYMRKSAELLNSNGLMIGLVPASPKHWGIEDDIAGHYRRYTKSQVQSLMVQNNWTLQHIAGLTFPVSNLLLPISNFLVNRSEKSKLSLSLIDRTKQSGHRSVKFKTHFPSLLGLILNTYVLWPFYLLQKVFKNSDRALVIYFESKANSDAKIIK